MCSAARRLVVLSSLLLVTACGGVQRTGTSPDSKPGDAPVSQAEITINNLSRADADAFRAQLLAQGDIEDVKLKSYRDGTAVYDVVVRGCECDLPAKIARIPSPGFRYAGRTTRLKYEAFDNRPPKVTFLHPENGRVLLEPELLCAIEVRDSDVAEVKVNGVLAEHYRADIYLARVTLRAGAQDIEVIAKDKAGLVTPEKVRVTLDLAPASDATIRVIVEGREVPGSTVAVEGKEVPVDAKGRYRTEIPVRRGQKQIEIVVLDPQGKKTVRVKEIGE